MNFTALIWEDEKKLVLKECRAGSSCEQSNKEKYDLLLAVEEQ